MQHGVGFVQGNLVKAGVNGSRKGSHTFVGCSLLTDTRVAMGQNPVPPVNIPIPTKIN